MRVLIVDDDPDNREAIKFWLAREFAGAAFLETTNWEELAAALLSGGFDAAIISCQLTWAPWKDVLKALKDKHPDVPLVMITDSGNDEIAVEAMKTGLSDFVLKRPLLRFLGEAVRESLEGVSSSRGRQYQLQGAGAPTAVIDCEFKIIEVNHAALETVGGPKEEILGRQCYEVLCGLSSPPPNCPLVRARKTKRHEVAEVRVGSGNVYLVSCTPVIKGSGEAVNFVHVAIDITKLERAETWLRVAGKVMDTTSERVVVTDANKRIFWANEAFTLITGYTLDDLKGKEPFFLHSDWGDEAFFEPGQGGGGEKRWQGRIWFRHKNGELHPQWVTVSAVRDDEGIITNYVVVCTSEARKEENPQAVEWLTHTDALTGLGNRLQFYSRFTAAAGLARRLGCSLALLYLDLDRFDCVNGAFGYAMGDRVLQVVAQRLRTGAREDDTLVRVAGDEFALLMLVGRPEEAAGRGREVLACLAEPIRIKGEELRLTASVGIAFYPRDAKDPDGLLLAGRTAAKRAKQRGRNTLAFCNRALHEAQDRRFALEQDLRRALEANEMVVYYQPRFSLKSGAASGVEALVRWRHSRRGLLLPGEFIDLAEETGLIVPLGERVLREACRQASLWHEAGYPGLTVAVNLSSRQFRQEGLVETVRSVLEETGLEPRLLELEITETTAIKDIAQTRSTLGALREMGVGIVIDDFGTGYGSLSYLSNFPVQAIKIDRSFVGGVTSSVQDASIVAAVIALARSLGCTSVAEGVETEEQLAWLREHGCDEAQGFFFSLPVPPDEILGLLRGQLMLKPALPAAAKGSQEERDRTAGDSTG